MIALGGAIGTGLFYGSATSIGMAGPAIVLSYLLGGAVIFLIMRALGEMSVHTPVSGAFSHYASQNWGPFAGFFSGWNYWFDLESWARDRGAKRLILQTGDRQPSAVTLYERVGYERIEICEPYVTALPSRCASKSS